MARPLPPVPSDPVRPPPVRVADERDVRFLSADGAVTLDGRSTLDAGAERVVVLAHPHPLYGGTQHNAVIVALARVCAERGVATLRFDYRGVGASTGAYDDGRGETADVLGAIAHARAAAPRARISLCGYSFGAWCALRAVQRSTDVDRLAMISPAVRILDFFASSVRVACPVVVVLGDRDEYAGVDETRALAAHLTAEFVLVDGADHAYLNGRRGLAERIVPWLAPG